MDAETDNFADSDSFRVRPVATVIAAVFQVAQQQCSSHSEEPYCRERRIETAGKGEEDVGKDVVPYYLQDESPQTDSRRIPSKKGHGKAYWNTDHCVAKADTNHHENDENDDYALDCVDCDDCDDCDEKARCTDFESVNYRFGTGYCSAPTIQKTKRRRSPSISSFFPSIWTPTSQKTGLDLGNPRADSRRNRRETLTAVSLIYSEFVLGSAIAGVGTVFRAVAHFPAHNESSLSWNSGNSGGESGRRRD